MSDEILRKTQAERRARVAAAEAAENRAAREQAELRRKMARPGIVVTEVAADAGRHPGRKRSAGGSGRS
jgi:hypothetical protein